MYYFCRRWQFISILLGDDLFNSNAYKVISSSIKVVIDIGKSAFIVGRNIDRSSSSQGPPRMQQVEPIK
ncbi:unnamed protein product [Fusarium venenatum]|uniref:Uncharacterized protein n=1 Tax=Fusarium venenatum TaxID=56646 RepID=A0A2L2TQX5_9HYPO|nr:uncharacterized protein FVRRES_06451 [Fusarium venenatum]CEI62015.1 unnamed protein product [Fusarium venenatum]